MRSNEERIAEVKRPDHWHLCSGSKPCADHLSLLFHT